jgi:hypothetical protein
MEEVNFVSAGTSTDRKPGERRDHIWRDFVGSKCGPTIMSALASSQGGNIEVNWRAGQPSDATDQSNLFLVQVWDPTWNELLTEQVATRTGSQKGNRTYTTTLSIPKSLSLSVLHVVVLGWNAETNPTGLTISNTFHGWRNFGYLPLTGPYISASVDVHV